MTHDELLATIDEVGYCLENGHTLLRIEIIDQIKALRAVVELHKPFEIDRELNYNCAECEWAYPCPTIQAIKKELQ